VCAEIAMSAGKAEPIREAVNFAHRKKSSDIKNDFYTSRTDS